MIDYKILIIDDSENDVILLMHALNKKFEKVEYFRVDNKEDLLMILEKEQKWDLIFADNMLPQLSGKESVEIIRNYGIITPIICISGSNFGNKSEECLKAGANHFILKENLDSLVKLSLKLLRNIC